MDSTSQRHEKTVVRALNEAKGVPPRDPKLVRLQDIADRLLSPHADKVYIAAGYTKADLRQDILKAISEK